MSIKSRKFISGGSLVVLLLIGIVVFLLAPAFTNSNTSAADALSDALSQTEQVKSYRFTVDSKMVEEETVRMGSTEAVVVFGEGAHFVTRMEGVPLAEGGFQETLLLLGKQYIRSRPDGEWKTFDTNFDPGNIPSLTPQQDFQMVDQLSKLQNLGVEDVMGVPARKIRGDINLTLKAQKMWGNNVDESGVDHRDQFLAGSEELTVWVGEDDDLIRAYEVKSTFPRFKTLTPFHSWYRVEISNFNEALELPRP